MKSLVEVIDLRRIEDTAPFYIEGHVREDRGNTRNLRIGVVWIAVKPQTLGESVRKIMVIVDVQPVHDQTSLSVGEVNLDGTVVHLDHPEHVVRVDMHVEVMNLRAQRKTRYHRNGGVQVKSNKDPRTLMDLTVGTDERALGEPHICSVRKRRVGARGSVGSGPFPVNVCETNETVEVCDL